MVAPVRFQVSCDDAYDYLIDPANRAAWQSSLRSVKDVEGPNGVVGQTWTDVTAVGIQPRMELTDADRPHRWSERGTWRGFRAQLTLTFTPVGTFCDVGVALHVAGTGLARPAGFVGNRLAPLAARSDLKRAAAILARA